VDSLPTSANQEDHVSMATFAGRRLADMTENTRGILAVELLAAAQGSTSALPCAPPKLIELAKGRLREEVGFYDKDRYFTGHRGGRRPCWAIASYNDLIPAGTLPSL
jgi:histidine ammonia-lyase